MAKKRTTKKIIKKPLPEDSITRVARAMGNVLGSEAVHKASDSDVGEPKAWIPSGLPELDRFLDREGRGWPTGRVIEVYGGEATCKTGLGYALVASAQHMGGSAVLYPAEGNWDEWLAHRYKVDLSQLILGEPPCTVESVFDSG
jgi:recombination protein RecA